MILAVEKQKQVNFCEFQARLVNTVEFQGSQGYVDRLSLLKTKTKSIIRGSLLMYPWTCQNKEGFQGKWEGSPLF